MKFTDKWEPCSDMQRVSRKEFCNNLDELLEKVYRDNVGIRITDKGKIDLVICPIVRFSKHSLPIDYRCHR